MLERAALKARQKVPERLLAEKARDQLRMDFIATEKYVGRPWEELDPSDQRVVLDALIDHVSVASTLRRGTTKFEPERWEGPGSPGRRNICPTAPPRATLPPRPRTLPRSRGGFAYHAHPPVGPGGFTSRLPGVRR